MNKFVGGISDVLPFNCKKTDLFHVPWISSFCVFFLFLSSFIINLSSSFSSRERGGRYNKGEGKVGPISLGNVQNSWLC